MKCHRYLTLVAAILVCLTAILAPPRSPAAQAKSSPLGPVGTHWGGQHISLEVTDDGVLLEFDCANGAIPKYFSADAMGNFTVKGEFTRERPGPITPDGNAPAPAIYSGTIQDNTMQLKISAGPKGDSVGEYVLERNQPGRVMKCK